MKLEIASHSLSMTKLMVSYCMVAYAHALRFLLVPSLLPCVGRGDEATMLFANMLTSLRQVVRGTRKRYSFITTKQVDTKRHKARERGTPMKKSQERGYLPTELSPNAPCRKKHRTDGDSYSRLRGWERILKPLHGKKGAAPHLADGNKTAREGESNRIETSILSTRSGVCVCVCRDPRDLRGTHLVTGRLALCEVSAGVPPLQG